MILALIMVLAIPCEAKKLQADTHLDATVTHKLELYSGLGVEYHVKINANSSFSNVYLHIDRQKFSGRNSSWSWESFDLTDYTVENGEYVFRYYGLTATEMPNIVRATVHAKQGSATLVSDPEDFSIRDYCTGLLRTYAGSSNSKEKKLCTLLVDLLNFGASAQNYFGINVGDLANSKLTTAQKNLGSKLPTTFSTVYAHTPLSGSTASIDHFEMDNVAMTCLSAFLKFTSNPDNNTYLEVSYTSVLGASKTITKSFSDFTYNSATGLYKVTLPEIKAPDCQTKLRLVVKKNGRAISGTYTYSMESYIQALVSSAVGGTEEGWAFVQNFMAYGISAKNYFSAGGSVSTPTPTKRPTSGPTTRPTNSPTARPTTRPTNSPTARPTTRPTNTPTPTPFTGSYVTYKQFGAKGDGVTDDYSAIVATHAYANEHNLPVKADPGAHYYIKDMDPNNKKGAVIMTDTDWGDAKFTIDDVNMPLEQGDCVLFTVAPSEPMQYKFIPAAATSLLGIDPNLSDYPEYPGKDAAMASRFINKSFPKGTTKLNGTFNEDALYYLERNDVKRWGRVDQSGNAEPRNQKEMILVRKDGTIDPATPVQWDWDNIYIIKKYYVDEQLLTVSGGTFTTKVNLSTSQTYINRGIEVNRCNVLLKGIKHYLTGEAAMFDSTSYAKVIDKKEDGTEIVHEYYHARRGAPYHGFFRVINSVYVTLQDCVFSNHHRVFDKGNETQSTAPYDFYAEQSSAITLNHCTTAAQDMYTVAYGKGLTGIDGFPKIALPKDKEGLEDSNRWGVMGGNFLKNLVAENGTAMNRIDAHKGTYNLTLRDTKVGYKGVAAVGFGEMILDNVTVYSNDAFITLRRDFGTAWYGNITITNCTWKLGQNYNPYLITNYYDASGTYAYDLTDRNPGDGYYTSVMPTKITINGLTLDASEQETVVFYRHSPIEARGFQIFSPIFLSESQEIDEAYLQSSKYPHHIKVTQDVYLSGLKIIKNKKFADPSYYVTVSIRNANCPDVRDEYFFTKSYDHTTLHWEDGVTYLVANG